MVSYQILEQLQSLVKQLKEKEEGTKDEINKIEGIIKSLKEEPLNENFSGTIQEIDAFIETAKESKETNELIKYHKLNLSRWTEELSLLIDGGGKVTFDYEQRKGREI
ncbi:YtzH-like family protein [Salipaludibacillus aurantiacus]|uniref:YtzH-like protein n=1 Tax=Salipaludibacillus aurantiacus TaxID=1601833 RepID=A0A1H9WNQ5_9BACI|nr:YtzH-like family protein [Salipaludibacillus aurantiacus]SES35053.1 YtzH-like protein [Salipaludibacillus aurantiacus]